MYPNTRERNVSSGENDWFTALWMSIRNYIVVILVIIKNKNKNVRVYKKKFKGEKPKILYKLYGVKLVWHR